MRALFATTVGILTFTAPMAVAQAADGLASKLAKDVACASPEARADLQDNMAKAAAAPADVLAALNVIAADANACAAARSAAAELAISLAPAPVVAPDNITAASNLVVADTLAEAERRANNMKFEVGPPPPRLTRGRSAGL